MNSGRYKYDWLVESVWTWKRVGKESWNQIFAGTLHLVIGSDSEKINTSSIKRFGEEFTTEVNLTVVDECVFIAVEKLLTIRIREGKSEGEICRFFAGMFERMLKFHHKRLVLTFLFGLEEGKY